MVIVSKSRGKCGFCGSALEAEWDLDLVRSEELGKKFRNFYASEIDMVCGGCGNKFSAALQVSEYPEGSLESAAVEIQEDKSGKSFLSVPVIEFFDL